MSGMCKVMRPCVPCYALLAFFDFDKWPPTALTEKEGNIFTKKEHKITEGYDGIFELCDPKQPTLETLDSIRCLRPLDPESDLFPADPLGALVCAITTLNDKNAGGCDKRSKQWRRTIYVITNGETEFNMHHADEIKEEILVSNIAVKVV